MTRETDPNRAESRADDVPEMVKPEMSDPSDPSTIGGANAEANGVWRVLRNSAALAVAALAVIAVIYAAS
ncbi:MAG: hypothetical protein VYD87_19430 [Pseudomonadota bacterium]|nr:hypothetical protein [Pseudomonadota bacterium]